MSDIKHKLECLISELRKQKEEFDLYSQERTWVYDDYENLKFKIKSSYLNDILPRLENLLK